jgi:hypothetical protein
MAEFIPTGIGGFAARPARRAITPIPDRSGMPSYERQELLPPPRPVYNFIPTPEAIDALVQRALAALAKGIYWDRGSIINLVL